MFMCPELKKQYTIHYITFITDLIYANGKSSVLRHSAVVEMLFEQFAAHFAGKQRRVLTRLNG